MNLPKACAVVSLLVLAVVGCNDPKEKFGRTWYLDGAGNLGFGVGEMVHGLEKAGYRGQVSAFHWSLTMNPLADQFFKPLAGLGAGRLAGCIQDYLKRHPDNDVNVVALSAGTAVALNAVKHLKPPYKINNMVLLAASVSCQYDTRPVLKNMKGKIYVYYSQNDAMLSGPVKVLGAFGGKLGDDPAGLCGLHAPGSGYRVVNIPWRPRYQRYGWTGSHTSCVSEAFVERVVSRHIMPRSRYDTTLADRRDGDIGADARGESSSGERLASASDSSRQKPTAKPDRSRRSSRARSKALAATSRKPPRAKPVPRKGPEVYAPPLGSELASAVLSPVVVPGKPATFMTLSRRDPRFPTRSRLNEAFHLRLIGVPGGQTARIAVQCDRKLKPVVLDMAARTGRRVKNGNGEAWAVTLLRVDAPSQTAWLQVRPVERLPRGSVQSRQPKSTTG